MFYKVARVVAMILLKVYFRKIYIEGIENFPREGPLFLAANHPDGFTEPLILATFLPRTLHFLVRGDVFENKALRPILTGTNQIPIYRSKDGFAQLRRNQGSFSEVYEKLKNGAAILIFAEGSTQLSKKIRPIQKGLAKMAYSLIKEHPELPLKISPISLYYVDHPRFRSEVIINIAPAITVDPQEIQQGEATVIVKKMTQEIERRMRSGYPSVNKEAERQIAANNYMAYEKFPYNTLPVVAYSKGRMQAQHHVVEDSVKIPQRKWIYWSVQEAVLLPFAVVGWLIHFIPAYSTYMLTRKIANSIVFTNALRMIIGLFVFLFYYLLIYLIMLFLPSMPLYVILCFPIFGILFLIYDSFNYKSYIRYSRNH